MSRQPRCLQSEFIAHLGEIIDLPFLLSLGFVSGKLSHRKRRGARIQFSYEHQDHLSQRKLRNKNVAWIMLLFYRAKWVENGLWNPQKAQITFALKSQLRSCLEAWKTLLTYDWSDRVENIMLMLLSWGYRISWWCWFLLSSMTIKS